MKLSDLFSQLSFGELKDLSIGNEGSGSVDETQYGTLITHINDSLSLLYSKYILKQKTITIPVISGQTEYSVPDDDAIQIISVYGPNSKEYLLNHIEGKGPIIEFPATIKFVHEMPQDYLTFHYQANHPEIKHLEDGFLDQEIELPRFMHEALRACIANKVYAQMNSEVSMIAEQKWFQKFNGILELLENRGLVQMNVNFQEADKFHKFGWK